MDYYFVKHATTNVGPINFAVAVQPGKTIARAVNDEGLRRRLFICHDWEAEPIDEPEYRDLIGETGSDQSCTLDCDCEHNCSCYLESGGEHHAIASL